jgi:hypothetical protein
MLLLREVIVGDNLSVRIGNPTHGEIRPKGKSELTEKTICYYLGFIISGVEWGLIY